MLRVVHNRIYAPGTIGVMTTGERLLNLTLEYRDSVAARSGEYEGLPGSPVGREPGTIAAEYETALRELLA